jgi:hypothetical protein
MLCALFGGAISSAAPSAVLSGLIAHCHRTRELPEEFKFQRATQRSTRDLGARVAELVDAQD